jgi:hypothetical protein
MAQRQAQVPLVAVLALSSIRLPRVTTTHCCMVVKQMNASDVINMQGKQTHQFLYKYLNYTNGHNM